METRPLVCVTRIDLFMEKHNGRAGCRLFTIAQEGTSTKWTGRGLAWLHRGPPPPELSNPATNINGTVVYIESPFSVESFTHETTESGAGNTVGIGVKALIPNYFPMRKGVSPHQLMLTARDLAYGLS
jgi:hypothetical protein